MRYCMYYDGIWSSIIQQISMHVIMNMIVRQRISWNASIKNLPVLRNCTSMSVNHVVA